MDGGALALSPQCNSRGTLKCVASWQRCVQCPLCRLVATHTFASLESVTSLALALFLSGVDPPTWRGSSARKKAVVHGRHPRLFPDDWAVGSWTADDGMPGPARCRRSSVWCLSWGDEVVVVLCFVAAIILVFFSLSKRHSQCYPILKRSGDGSKAPAGGCWVGMRGTFHAEPGPCQQTQTPHDIHSQAHLDSTKLPMLSLSGLLLSHTAVHALQFVLVDILQPLPTIHPLDLPFSRVRPVMVVASLAPVQSGGQAWLGWRGPPRGSSRMFHPLLYCVFTSTSQPPREHNLCRPPGMGIHA